MDSISPLAKILAEANGIDWRSLQGSGAGGSVVEQDILNYLSRIMSGDEEPPATPVDEAPPGWTGEMPPMPVARAGLEALSAAGVESDITDFVAQQSQAAQSASAPPAPEFGSATAAPARSSALNDDLEFELDDLDDSADNDLTATDVTAAGSEPNPVARPSAETPIHETVFLQQDVSAQPDALSEFGTAAVYGEARLDTNGPNMAGLGMNGLGAEVLGQPVYSEPAHPEAARPEAAHPETAHPETAQAEAVQFQQPAYDPVALDADADFVMADGLPGLPATPQEPEAALQPLVAEHAGASQLAKLGQPVEDSQPVENSRAVDSVQPEYGRPAGKEQPAATAEAATGAGGASGFGLGSFLSRLYGGKAKAEAEAAPVTSIPASSTAPMSAEATMPPAASDVAAPTLQGPNLGEALIPQAPPVADTLVAAPLVADQWRDQELTGPELPALELSEAPHTELSQPTDLPEAHEANQHEVDQNEANQEVNHETPLIDHQTMAETGPDGDSSDAAPPRAASEMPAPEAPTPEVTFSERHETEQPADRSPSWTDTALPLGVAAGVGAAASDTQHPDTAPAHAEPSVPVTATSVSALSPASHTAITLRLNLDLHALETARAQLSTALVRDVPLGLLVARAAARSLSALGLHLGEEAAEGVALANHAGQPLATDLRAEFRASLEGLGQVAQAQPALLVLDASALGLDELHRGECSLSVGRAATNGAGAALSLRGDLDPARGAQFLHEVAGLLGTPILLLF